MLVKKLIPLKYLALLIQIILAAFILATKSLYSAQNTATTEERYIFI